MPEKEKIQAKRLFEKEVEAITKKHEFKYTVYIADSTRDLWLCFRKQYPNAIHVGDFFHVCEHLSKLSELFFKESSDAKAWYKKTPNYPKRRSQWCFQGHSGCAISEEVSLKPRVRISSVLE